MVDTIVKETEEKMKKTLEVLRKEFVTIRAGSANQSMLDKIMVDYYGTPTPINQVANISVPEPRMLVIQPWEKTMIQPVEKAIMKSDLGINPVNDGSVVRLVIPQLTADRRTEIVRTVKKKAEEARVSVRNIRRDMNEEIKKMEKDKTVSEDESKKGQEKIQKLTDKYIKDIDDVLSKKEKEITEV
ncbi:ribosome recycling factor [Syntrophobotulus glycolicus DSM 8271]|uniref:Ribosome-recycling factor n=1 Tax=Syntrophobotulus glycolicus (strain DSM 8271 / FlGlyR) TaxID=645991 RepID=F0SUA4_SYNGF|nr:ribosome recycling factor [Syntrophobotulus glycolicus]ADY56554.1 ribosome recycling factor [Syntrophobotulus glycolicus DSM 8271]